MPPSSRSAGTTPTHTLCAYAYFGCCARAGGLTPRHVFRPAVTPSAASLSKWMLHGFPLCKSESCVAENTDASSEGRVVFCSQTRQVQRSTNQKTAQGSPQLCLLPSAAFLRQCPDSPVNSKLLILVHNRIKKLESVSRHNRTLSLASCSILALDTFRVHYTETYPAVTLLVHPKMQLTAPL